MLTSIIGKGRKAGVSMKNLVVFAFVGLVLIGCGTKDKPVVATPLPSLSTFTPPEDPKNEVYGAEIQGKWLIKESDFQNGHSVEIDTKVEIDQANIKMTRICTVLFGTERVAVVEASSPLSNWGQTTVRLSSVLAASETLFFSADDSRVVCQIKLDGCQGISFRYLWSHDLVLSDGNRELFFSRESTLANAPLYVEKVGEWTGVSLRKLGAEYLICTESVGQISPSEFSLTKTCKLLHGNKMIGSAVARAAVPIGSWTDKSFRFKKRHRVATPLARFSGGRHLFCEAELVLGSPPFFLAEGVPTNQLNEAKH